MKILDNIKERFSNWKEENEIKKEKLKEIRKKQLNAYWDTKEKEEIKYAKEKAKFEGKEKIKELGKQKPSFFNLEPSTTNKGKRRKEKEVNIFEPSDMSKPSYFR